MILMLESYYKKTKLGYTYRAIEKEKNSNYFMLFYNGHRFGGEGAMFSLAFIRDMDFIYDGLKDEQRKPSVGS